MRRSKLVTGMLVVLALLLVVTVVTLRFLDSPRDTQSAAQPRPTDVSATSTGALQSPAVADTNASSFAAWRQQLGTAPMTPAFLDEGRRRAQARREMMRQLMRENPLRALEQSLKWNEWMALPAEIRALVEEPFSETVELSVVPDCRPVNARTTPWQTHRVKMRGEWFNAFVYGRRASMSSKNGTPVQGIRLENQVALWENAGLALQSEELSAVQQILPDGNDRTRSWLTGEAIQGVAVAALVGGKVHYFAANAELQEVTRVIAEAEAQPGPMNVVEAMAAATAGFGGTFNTKSFAAKSSLAKSAWTENPKRVLLMRVDFTPAIPNPYTTAVLQAEFLSSSNTFREMSFNKTWLINTMVASLITIPNPQSYWETNTTGSDGIMDYAKSRLASLGYNTNNYDIFVVSMPFMQRYSGAAAFAQVGGQHLWINGGPHGPMVATHELGHNYGYVHANYWRGSTGAGLLGHTNGGGGLLEHQDYGDFFEIMSDDRACYPQGHFGMQAKALFNWIEPAEIVNVATSGVYRVRRFDHINARQLAGTKLALFVTNAFGDRFLDWLPPRADQFHLFVRAYGRLHHLGKRAQLAPAYRHHAALRSQWHACPGNSGCAAPGGPIVGRPERHVAHHDHRHERSGTERVSRGGHQFERLAAFL